LLEMNMKTKKKMGNLSIQLFHVVEMYSSRQHVTLLEMNMKRKKRIAEGVWMVNLTLLEMYFFC
jgi:hypothetical protein